MVSVKEVARSRGRKVAKSAFGPKRQLTDEERGILVGLHNSGLSIHGVAKQSGVPYTTVRQVVDNFEQRGSVKRQTGSGRPRKTTRSEDEHMILAIKRDRGMASTNVVKDLYHNRISPSTVRRRIHELTDLKSHLKTRKPFISARNRQRRINWCVARLGWSKEQWRRFLFSDESPFLLRFHGRTRVWRTADEYYRPFAMTGTVKHDDRINVWGCFTAHSVGNLYLVDGILDQYQYHKILQEEMLPSAEKLFGSVNWTFQQDNDPKHTAKSTQKLIRRLDIPLEDWPSQSPDLNPIENLWAELDRRTANRKCNTKAELFETLKEAWNALPSDYLTKLIDSMPERLNAVLDNKGYPTDF